jgi:hypothetical protein
MRFFTRVVFDELQESARSWLSAAPASGPLRTAWDRAADAYRQYLDSIRPNLPEDARLLAETDLHDYRILKLDRSDAIIRLLVGSPWCKPRFNGSGLLVTFEGVSQTSTTGELVGQSITAHEVAMIGDDAIEFSALLELAEFFVCFTHTSVEKWGGEWGKGDKSNSSGTIGH